jgi:hypothetical protein
MIFVCAEKLSILPNIYHISIDFLCVRICFLVPENPPKNAQNWHWIAWNAEELS